MLMKYEYKESVTIDGIVTARRAGLVSKLPTEDSQNKYFSGTGEWASLPSIPTEFVTKITKNGSTSITWYNQSGTAVDTFTPAGSGEPAAYIKEIKISDDKKTLTFVKKGETIGSTFEPVSGTASGDTWTELTIGNEKHALAQGGGTPTNMVTTDTEQAISGKKTFSNGVNVTGTLQVANTVGDTAKITMPDTGSASTVELQFKLPATEGTFMTTEIDGGVKTKLISYSEYTALTTKDPKTLYLVYIDE